MEKNIIDKTLDIYIKKHRELIYNCYKKECARYRNFIERFLKKEFIKGLEPIILSGYIVSIPEDIEYKLHTTAENFMFSNWLFESTYLFAKEAKVGDTITHNLPLSFKLYIADGRRDRLAKKELPIEYCLKDFNQMANICVKTIKKLVEPVKFDVELIEDSINYNKFEFITIGTIIKREYNNIEDQLFKAKYIEDVLF